MTEGSGHPDGSAVIRPSQGKSAALHQISVVTGKIFCMEAGGSPNYRASLTLRCACCTRQQAVASWGAK